jgi:hypothetical protein
VSSPYADSILPGQNAVGSLMQREGGAEGGYSPQGGHELPPLTSQGDVTLSTRARTTELQPARQQGVGGLFQGINQGGAMPLDRYKTHLYETYAAPRAQLAVDKGRQRVDYFLDLVGQAERAHFGGDSQSASDNQSAPLGSGMKKYEPGLT